MSMRTVRRMAAELLGVGESRVWINPAKLKEIEKVYTKDDVRKLIESKDIVAVRKKGVSHARGRIRKKKKAKRGLTPGKRKKRVKKKEIWMRKVRALRKILKILEKKYNIPDKRKLYLKIKGGEIRDKSHLISYVIENYKKK